MQSSKNELKNKKDEISTKKLQVSFHKEVILKEELK